MKKYIAEFRHNYNWNTKKKTWETEKFRVFNNPFHKPGKEYHIDFTTFKSGDISGEKDGTPWRIKYHNADITGTNEYADMTVITAEDPYAVLESQLSDGYFENSNYSSVWKWDEEGQRWLEPCLQLIGNTIEWRPVEEA